MGINFIPVEEKFFDLFDQQVDNMVKAADYFAELAKSGKFDDTSVKTMRDLEHEGDTLCHEIVDTINRTFVTPFDREDILLLTGNLDDVVDRIHSITTRMRLYKLNTPDSHMQQFAEVIQQSSACLAKAIKGLRDIKRSRRILDCCIEINRLENVGDQLREAAIVNLFENTKDPIVVIKWKEMYEVAEAVLDICEHVAKTVESILVKQS